MEMEMLHGSVFAVSSDSSSRFGTLLISSSIFEAYHSVIAFMLHGLQ